MTTQNQTKKSAGRKRKENPSTNDLIDKNDFYIANQGNGGFDEVQRLAIAIMNKQPVVIEGEPGIGKNQAIRVLVKALQIPSYRIRCTEEMMARDIIGGDKLAVERSENGDVATKTQFEWGKLLRAMQEGGLVILDEVNQLLPTVQKALNSALEDYRTLGNLEGSMDVQAKDNFGLFLTYNPSTGVANNDLEVALRDRCKILHFDNLPTELKARIALLGTKQFELEDFLKDGSLGIRGLQKPNGTLGFVEYKYGRWVQLNKEDGAKGGFIQPYLYFNRDAAVRLRFDDDTKDELYQVTRSIVKSLDRLNKLPSEGTTQIIKDLELEDVASIGRLNLNRSSPRIVKKIVQDYILLRSNGYSIKESTADALCSIVDYVVPPEEREQKIGDQMTVSGLVQTVCESYGIMTTNLARRMESIVEETAKAGIVRALTDQGYTESVAKKILKEYM